MPNKTEQKKKWVKKLGYVSEFKVDARWVLYEDGNPKPQGSLRIVSHPDCPPGHMKAICAIVKSRSPKTKTEIEETKKIKYKDTGEVSEVFNNEELELYSIDEHLTMWDIVDVAPTYKLEEKFGVKIFG